MNVEEAVQYRSGDVDINALLMYPDGACADSALPAVIFHPSHGSPPGAYRWLFNALCDAGLVCLGIGQRGFDSGTAADNDRGGPLQQGDLKHGLTYLSSLEFVDPRQLFVSGHSNGAALALIVAATDRRVRGCVSFAPKTDWVRALTMARQWMPTFYARTVQEMNGGIGPEDEPAPYIARSPLTYASSLTVPVLMVVGTQDWVNPKYHCEWMRDALLAAGNDDVTIADIEDVEHFFCQRHFRGYRFAEVIAQVVPWLTERGPSGPAT